MSRSFSVNILPTGYSILLTDVSFRVRLLRVTYVDTDRNDRERVSLAFLIEHRDRLAKRIGASAIETNMVTYPDLNASYTNLASVFHYFIGNTDYSPVTTVPSENCCHNHALFANEDGTIYSVPYDFDMSGFVNAPYAAPNPRFRLRNVLERVSAPCRAQQKKATSNEVACLAKPSKSRGLIHQRILKIRTAS